LKVQCLLLRSSCWWWSWVCSFKSVAPCLSCFHSFFLFTFTLFSFCALTVRALRMLGSCVCRWRRVDFGLLFFRFLQVNHDGGYCSLWVSVGPPGKDKGKRVIGEKDFFIVGGCVLIIEEIHKNDNFLIKTEEMYED